MSGLCEEWTLAPHQHLQLRAVNQPLQPSTSCLKPQIKGFFWCLSCRVAV